MIVKHLKDPRMWRIVRCLFSLMLLVFAVVFARAGDYSRACFDLLLAALTAPEVWLRNSRE